MKRVIAAAAVAAFGFVDAASAADLPRKAPPIVPAPALYSWSGFYVGGNVGGTWSTTDWTFFNGANSEAFSQHAAC